VTGTILWENPGTPEIQARRNALRRALALGAGVTAVCLAVGKPTASAATDGLIVAFGGLVAWTVYHLVARRHDALALVAMNTLPVWRDPDDPWLPMLVITTLAMLGVGLVMGLVNRPEALARPDPSEMGWWDADLDGPK